jgi:YVTN family beta-propeller protein
MTIRNLTAQTASAPTLLAMAEVGAGSRLGPFVIGAEIARGGMGIVFRARQPSLERDVALKLIDPRFAADPGYRTRFLREARLAARVEHPHAVPIYDSGEADGQLFMAMRLIRGRDLGRLIANDSWLDAEQAVEVLEQIAGALDAVHQEGLIHRDVKPANVIMGGGEQTWAYLTDFGIARGAAEDTVLTGTGERIGTADYSSPEQIRGEEVGPASDIYSLGCLFYACLAGAAPFRRDDEVATIHAHLHEEPKPLGPMGQPGSLDPVVRRALAKEPGERFSSAREFAQAARFALAGGDVAGAPTRRLAPGREPSRARRLRWVAALALLLVVAAAGGLLAWAPWASEPVVAETFSVGDSPFGVAVEDGWLWIAQSGDGTLLRVDTDDTSARRSFPAGDRPSGVRAVNDRVWVTDPAGDSLLRFGDDGEQLGSTRIQGRPSGLRVGEGSVWVTAVAAGGVAKVRLEDGSVEHFEPVGPAPSGVGAGEGAVWVANAGAGTVTRLAPGQGDVVGDPIPVGARPRGVSTGEGAVWVANALDGTVSRIDPSTSTVTDTVQVGGRPAQIAVGEGAVWVTNERDDSVSRIDPDSLEVTEELDVGDGPRGIAAGEGSVWVANYRGDTVTRIDP